MSLSRIVCALRRLSKFGDGWATRGRMPLKYFILDVFTERAFGGNPLAVVIDADALTTAEMQTIAREFNLSETVFVLKPQSPGHTARMRIFTPAREIPFAGHPAIGTAALLAGLRAPSGNGEHDAIIALEQEIGSVRVGVRLRNGQAAYGEFDAPYSPGTPEKFAEIDEIAAALGLISSEIGFENHRPHKLPGATVFAFVPIANLEAMSKVSVSPGPWSRAFSNHHISGAYLYTRQCIRAHSSFHARMLAPDLGIPEDPATGSAAIGFSRMIQTLDALPDGVHKRSIEQGLEMGRPSTINLVISVARGQLHSVRIGGHAVQVAEGVLNA